MEAEVPKTVADQTVKIAAATRAQNRPAEETADGKTRGRWRGEAFELEESFVPTRHNPEKRSVGELKTQLREEYGLELGPIPFDGGVADFGAVSVANIPTDDIAVRSIGMDPVAFEALSHEEKLEIYKETFRNGRRNSNFHIADELAAERHIYIPGLGKDYTAAQLQEWRKEHHFSWDEQLYGGYNLVPAVIHGNVPHSGLVSTASRASDAWKELADAIAQHPEEFCFSDDDDTPISLDDLERLRDT